MEEGLGGVGGAVEERRGVCGLVKHSSASFWLQGYCCPPSSAVTSSVNFADGVILEVSDQGHSSAVRGTKKEKLWGEGGGLVSQKQCIILA